MQAFKGPENSRCLGLSDKAKGNIQGDNWEGGMSRLGSFYGWGNKFFQLRGLSLSLSKMKSKSIPKGKQISGE